MDFRSGLTVRIAVKALLVGLIALLVPIIPAAQVGDNLPRAFRFIDAVYPELRSRAAVTRVEGYVYSTGPWFLHQFGVQVADSPKNLQDHRGLDGLGKVFFKASFGFGKAGLTHFTAFGRFVRFQDNQDFVRALAQRPEWSELEIGQELARLGAKYGPDQREALALVCPPAHIVAEIAQTEPLMVSDMTFKIPIGDERRAGGAGAVAWQITYKPASGRQGAEFVANLEPFEGKLGHLFRVDLGVDAASASLRKPQ